MKIIDVKQNTPEWEELRKGKIGGSDLKDIITLKGTGTKIGFYQLMADRLGIVDDDPEDARERGHTLEQESIKEFEKQTSKKVQSIGYCISDKNPNLGLSPDGAIKKGSKYPEMVETKSLKASLHLKAYYEKEVPEDYKAQKLNYFIVNEECKTLYFCFYNPNVTMLPFFYLEFHRKDLQDEIQLYEDLALAQLERLDTLLETFF